MTPGSCTTGIHILLEELELIFEVHLVNLMAGDQNSEAFLTMNPKGTIPALQRDDGTALTDFQAIAWWLARRYPKAKLLPETAEGEVMVLDVMNYAIGTIHMQGFARIFTTDKFTPHESEYDWVKLQGREIIDTGFAVINDQLSEEGYVLSNFSIADAALFYVEFWAVKTDIPLPDKCLQHYELMLNRPVVRQVLMEEGYKL